MKEMFLSFIVPVYNAHLYLDQCLRSLINQNIPYDNFEIICVDDGSTDGSKEILEKYAEEFNNIIVSYQVNSGVSSARNKGLKHAEGKYIWFVDADDFIAPDILEGLKKIAINTNADRIKLESYSFECDLSLNEQEKLFEKTLVSNAPYKEVLATRTLYKREYLLENNISFPEGVCYGEDGVFNYQTLIHNPLTADSNVLAYFYRRHNGAVTRADRTVKAKKSIEGSKAVLDILIKDYNNKVCLKETRRMLLYWMRSILNNYSVLDCSYFKDNFVWNYHLKKIPLCDFELRRLNALFRKLSKSRDFRKLISFVNRQTKQADFSKMKKAKYKKISYYMKHPRRFLRRLMKTES